MSAIPWVGQDIVEFLWGGLCILIILLIEEPYNSNIVLKILFVAGISIILEVIYVFVFNVYLDVKKITTKGQSAEVINVSTINASQRLNTENLIYAYLVGLIEGNGWFSISKKGKYLTYEFGIEVSIRDVQLIYKIKKILGVGVITFRKSKNRSETVFLRVRNKSHIINYILPIFDKYPLFSNKQYDYIRFKNTLLSDLKYSEFLPQYIRPINTLNSIESILKASYFSAWLIGFMEAEGCFSVYKPTIDPSLIASFDIAQTNDHILILAIYKYLSLTTKIKQDKTNCFKLKVSNVRSIENIVKFIQKAPVKFLGYKKLQYLLWLKQLRTIPRYTKKFNIPDKY